MGKTVVCKLEPNGYLSCKVYILGNGYILNQIDTNVFDVADTISAICENNEIEKVAIYGSPSHLGRIRACILANKTKFAYNNTQILINPVEGVI